MKHFIILLLTCISSSISCLVYGQTSSGFFPINRFGISYQKVLGVDLGLISYNMLFGRGNENFFDVSLGAESLFDKKYVLAPKISADIGASIGGSLFTIGGGADLSMPTDFSHSMWMFTPKVGITAGSLIRIYYGHSIWNGQSVFNRMGKHRVSLEINTAAFHDFKIGL